MEAAFIQVQTRIDSLLLQDQPLILAIDGNCTAGKTTLASRLSQHYDCNVFHMDDFFLRPEQRTSQRFSQPGGNVDYERFAQEILIPLVAGIPFSYRPFDCSSFMLAEPVAVVPKKLNIVEGTYSLHPYFHDPYHLKIFMAISPELQRRRILVRPSFLHQRFLKPGFLWNSSISAASTLPESAIFFWKKHSRFRINFSHTKTHRTSDEIRCVFYSFEAVRRCIPVTALRLCHSQYPQITFCLFF
ncbi:MAG: hypothetical protein J6V25_02250 [Oscillospiraceae bacterium]|nr:hypothetical protein [Oscillospiraceae bacterium]